MDTTIERKFFKAYDSTEWIEDCTYWIKNRRGLAVCTEEAESKRHWYEEELPAKIMEWADSIRDEVCGKRSPLMEEITANIDSLTDERERERYIFSLLSPFGEYVEQTNIDEKIARISQNIQEDREQISAWREVVEDEETPQEEKEYGKRAIETLSELIDKNKEELVRKQKEQETLTMVRLFPHGETEKAFRQLCVFVTKFGMALDAHLLERGIDLLRYERITGIKLVGKRRKDLVGDYLGSEKLAQHYIDALLPKLDEQKTEEGDASDSSKVEGNRGERRKTTSPNGLKVDEGAMPKFRDEKNFKKLMQEIAKLEPTIVTVLKNDPNGHLWKWEGAMGLLDFVCGRFFCGDKVSKGKGGKVTITFGDKRMPSSKVAPYFSNVTFDPETKKTSLGAQRNNWKSLNPNRGFAEIEKMPADWEKAEVILKGLGI